MLKVDPELARSLEDAVTALEAKTSVEIVVVAAGRSEAYAELPWMAGALAGLLTLALVLFSPWVFAPAVVLPGVLFVAVGAGLIALRAPRLTRALVPKARQLANVERAARAAFVEERVHGTEGRDAILVYLSALEGRLALEADLGLRRAVPPGALGTVRFGGGADPHSIDTSANLLAGLRALGALLAEHAPAPSDNPNTLRNAARIRP